MARADINIANSDGFVVHDFLGVTFPMSINPKHLQSNAGAHAHQRNRRHGCVRVLLFQFEVKLTRQVMYPLWLCCVSSPGHTLFKILCDHRSLDIDAVDVCGQVRAVLTPFRQLILTATNVFSLTCTTRPEASTGQTSSQSYCSFHQTLGAYRVLQFFFAAID